MNRYPVSPRFLTSFPSCTWETHLRPGSARVSRAGFGVSPKRTFNSRSLIGSALRFNEESALRSRRSRHSHFRTWGEYTPRVSRSALWPNLLCRRPARIRCEDYGKIVLQRGVHRFNYESLQTLADVGRAHSSNIIVMICDDGLNCGNFLLGCHAVHTVFASAPATQKDLTS